MKKNIVANYLGQSWQGLMSLAFMPVYIKYLGIEAYGLIGIYSFLQAWLAIVDVGMRPAVGREMARFTGGGHSAQSVRDLLRSVEVIAIAIAGMLALSIWAASRWLASDWIVASLPIEVTRQAFAIMGIVIALRLLENIYMSSLSGLQRQVLQNVLSSVSATARAVGAVGVLAWVSPTIEAYFLWQALISLVTVLAAAAVSYCSLPAAPCAPRVSPSALLGIWRFAAGMTAISFLALLLTQVDKLLLSRLLNMESFGYYALAAMVSNALSLLPAPITTAFYPRFTELAANGDIDTLRVRYHGGAQLVTVTMGAAATILIMFGETVLRVWSGDPSLARKVAPILAVLALGTLLNGLMSIPYQLQLAHGWTSLTVKVNVIAVIFLIPAVLWLVPAYGPIAAAWAWVALNAAYLIFVVPLMHLRLLRTEKVRWYLDDVALPLGAAASTGSLCRCVFPQDLGKLGELGVLLVTASCVLMAAALTADTMRHQVTLYVFARFRPLLSTDRVIIHDSSPKL